MTTVRILVLLIPFLLTSCEAMAGEILPIAFASFAKDDLYRSGQKALDEKRWNEAASIFGKVAERGGSDADAGLYWRAYAQHKAGNRSESLATIRRLASTYPKSAWLDDARALEVEVRGDQGVTVQPSAGEDEELKLYALSGMMDNNPRKALPLVRQYLRGKHSLENKEKALFLLTQSDLP
jgi:outer membrane protein assembly factor BamD (BamD/ComL family)